MLTSALPVKRADAVCSCGIRYRERPPVRGWALTVVEEHTSEEDIEG